MKHYLIDTNVIIDLTAGRLPSSSEPFMSKVFEKAPAISVITKIEVLGFKMSSAERTVITEFTSDVLVIGLSDEITEKTINLRKNHRIKLPDAIIAATAMVSKRILLTRNLSDFTSVKGLELTNPHQR